MSTFKVGDRVRSTNEKDACYGRVGVITKVHDYEETFAYDVSFGDGLGDQWRFLGDFEFELEGFVTHDSGERAEYASGMVRDTDAGKLRYDLIDRPMLKRVAGLYTRGAVKYGDNNWTLANSEEELIRFRASAFRHFIQWINGERDEDHGAAVFFNIAAAEHVREKLKRAPE